MKKQLRIAMFGHKRIPSREGGIEIVVEELCTRMVRDSNQVTCYNRAGHHVSGLVIMLHIQFVVFCWLLFRLLSILS